MNRGEASLRRGRRKRGRVVPATVLACDDHEAWLAPLGKKSRGVLHGTGNLCIRKADSKENKPRDRAGPVAAPRKGCETKEAEGNRWRRKENQVSVPASNAVKRRDGLYRLDGQEVCPTTG